MCKQNPSEQASCAGDCRLAVGDDTRHATVAMTTTRTELIERTETADEYGRRETCLRNHRRAPFCFQANISDIQSTAQHTDPSGLVAQPSLRAIALPQPNAIHQTVDSDQMPEANLMTLLEDTPLQTPPLVAGLSRVKELRIPVESLDLGSYPGMDAQEYINDVSAKRYCNPFDQWLPLTSLNIDRDESLLFPPKTGRLQSLLQRELEHEKLTSSGGASILEEAARGLPWTVEDEMFMATYTRPELSRYSYPGPITPPLSPVSELASPFIPNSHATVIDLISEPGSPIDQAVQLLQSNVLDGCFDSEPVLPSTLLTSSPSQGLPNCTGSLHETLEAIKVDVPIVLTSSDMLDEENLLASACLPSITNGEHFLGGQHEETYFENAFMTLLDERSTHAGNLAGQERLNPSDSVSRVPVPVLNFEIPQPDWSSQCSSANSHFIWLRNSLQTGFDIPVVPRDFQSDSALKWTPVPQKSGRIKVNEDFRLSSESARSYLAVDAMPTLSSASFVLIRPSMAVLQPSDDEEVEDPAPLPDAHMTQDSSPAKREQSRASPSHTGSVQEAEPSSLKEQDKQDWTSLIRPLRRKVFDDSLSVLPKHSDTSATSRLLSGFMELRAAKKPRFGTSSLQIPREVTINNSSSQLQKSASVLLKDQATFHSNDRELVPATAPKAEMPSEKGSFIVSLSLGRSLLRHLEVMWPSENLIDMDYLRHAPMTQLQATGRQKESTSPLIFEADMTLSPSIGIIITNLLKVKQRSLPGSKSQTPLRERIQRVSQKYKALVVLVSESNPGGEFTGILAPSDVAAYADFVRFAIAIDADVTAYFVPGAEATLAKWIVSLMCRYSHQSVALKRFLSADESSWEVFLRRAGMNVMAAKVLSKTLFEEAGPTAFAQFLVMPMGERVSKYGQLLGGEKALRMSGEILDRKWGEQA